MRNRPFTVVMMLFFVLALSASLSFSAYHHMNEEDSSKFLQRYPGKKDTKLDSCALCHSGGNYEKKPGVFIPMGSCQWCHYKYGYDATGNITETLNPYGKDYWLNGRNADAVKAIENKDSDEDGFSNLDEIMALRYPGDAADDPNKIVAPSRIYSKEDLSQLTQHTQFMMMNTSRSGDFYAEYTGVPLEILLEDAGILDSATGITVYAPDGWSNYHPLEPVDEYSLYHIKGTYAQAQYYYEPEAEDWCDYSAPLCSSFSNGQLIPVSGGLKAILALQRNGANLTIGVLNNENKLDGAGPYRIVVPQKNPSPPDQSSNSDNQNVIWPHDENNDHNAGFCTRSVTIIKVEPLPEGTTDINLLEAGWDFIDQEKIIIYGAIQGQTGSITGKLMVSKGNDLMPFANATVTVVETGHKAVSNQDGLYTIENIPVGEYAVLIKHDDNPVLMIDSVHIEENIVTQMPMNTIYFPKNPCDVDNNGVIGLKDLIHWFKVFAKMVD
jgi:hypothetical protein